MRAFALGLLIGVGGVSVGPASADEVLRCKITPDRAGSLLPETVEIRLRGRFDVDVTSSVLAEHGDTAWVEGKVEVRNAKRTSYTWLTKGVPLPASLSSVFSGDLNHFSRLTLYPGRAIGLITVNAPYLRRTLTHRGKATCITTTD